MFITFFSDETQTNVKFFLFFLKVLTITLTAWYFGRNCKDSRIVGAVDDMDYLKGGFEFGAQNNDKIAKIARKK